MNAAIPPLSAAVLSSVQTPIDLRPAAVTAGRARVASGEWPPALALADAILAQMPFLPVSRDRR